MREYTTPDTYAGAITDLRERAGSVERTPAPAATPTYRVCITAAGTTQGFTGAAMSTPWRPWVPVTFTDLRLELLAAPASFGVTMYTANGPLGNVSATASTTGFATIGPVTVDIWDQVWFQVTSDTSGPAVWHGFTVQAIGTSAHPISAGLVFVDGGGGV